jgi:hypothetical protein
MRLMPNEEAILCLHLHQLPKAAIHNQIEALNLTLRHQLPKAANIPCHCEMPQAAKQSVLGVSTSGIH